MEVPLLCGPRGLMNVKPHQFSELGDLGASSLGGIHNNWGTYVWISSFQGEVGDLVLETSGDVPTSSNRLLGGMQSAPIRRQIRSQNLRQQLGKYALKSFWGRTGRWTFLSSPCAEPRVTAMGRVLACPVDNFFFVCYNPGGLI